MSSQPWQNRDTLRELHIEQGLQAGEIADRLGCSKSTVLKWCDRFDIDYDQNRAKPWWDEEKLRRLYYDEGLSTGEISDRLGCSPTTIRETMEKFGIDRREPPDVQAQDSPWRDADLLEQLYNEKQQSPSEIAGEFNCTANTIIRWLDRHGIERRDRDEEMRRALRKRPASFYTKGSGYEIWTNQFNGSLSRVYVHRLLAVSEYGSDSVCDMDVHHQNGIPWDNRPENIELISKEEHGRHHANERWGDESNDKQAAREIRSKHR